MRSSSVQVGAPGTPFASAPRLPIRPTAPRAAGWTSSGVAWSAIVSAAVVLWVLILLGGYDYYTTPLAVRGYAAGHRLLRPSGPVGQTLGLVGALMMLMPFLYMLRKRLRWLRSAGSLRGWLEAHLFCGIVGPVLVTLHTSFKFNGIVSTAYWSMVIVVLSGFVGRYLFVRIPRSIRGSELTRGELDARSESLKSELVESAHSMDTLRRVEAFQHNVVTGTTELSWVDLFTGEIWLGRKLRQFERELLGAGVMPDRCAQIVGLVAERAMLLRRIAYLQKTKTLFGLWHVFHLPLVYLLVVIVAAHVAITVYLGYAPFRW